MNYNILLVNDDGIQSDRLKYAKEVLSKYGKVLVVAPLEEQSGKSVSISIAGIKFQKISNYEYAVIGTPADCVTFALFGLDFKPDIVISGINKGYNIGIDTIYSGTVGAALQASYHGFKAVAFSADYTGMDNMKKYFETTFLYIIKNQLLSNDYILNVNFPKEVFKDERPIKMTRLFYVKMLLEGKIENDMFIHKRNVIPQEIPKDTDVYALRNGFISISKISFNKNL
ncbi:MAG: 5'/3'-nucleotidase SurE [Candidatus Izemoplasmataceae bacterium]